MESVITRMNVANENNCQVCVRVRPFKRGEEETTPCAVAGEDGRTLLAQRDERKGGAYLRSQQATRTNYTFDATFGSDSTQQHVYESTTRPHVAPLADGSLPALTVIAYGATGAGKTHTMMGAAERGGANGDRALSGIIPRCVVDLFAAVGAGATVTASYLELYNERVFDLLGAGANRPLRVCEDEKRGVVEVLDLTAEPVASAGAVLALGFAGARQSTAPCAGALPTPTCAEM